MDTDRIWKDPSILGPMYCKQPVFTDMTLFRINAQTQCRVLILFRPNTKLKCATISLFMHMSLIQLHRVPKFINEKHSNQCIRMRNDISMQEICLHISCKQFNRQSIISCISYFGCAFLKKFCNRLVNLCPKDL